MALGLPPNLPLPPADEEAPGPPNSATPQELGANPGLARLLRNLGGLLGEDGLSPPLQKELSQAEVSLCRARTLWLHLELLWRILGELIRDPRNLEPSLLRALEQELTWAQVRRGPPEIARLLPPPQLRSLGSLQAHLDRGRGLYLLAKGGAVLLKSRLEELRILLDSYPAPTIEAHRRIRAGLSERRRAAEAQAAILGAELAALRGLGPEFRDLALELGRIRRESDRKRWALRQLRPRDVTDAH
ncbi:HAUS augmin-like complex subunit 4 [Poecile atricapillus]|uniref:HAUS augmin-like complex subunit 4 n=1 Tax=Poecile atricapillus TaxID=48891 RepID=UPI002738707E|nr:HAUS augmin-like complex subunit 4 [Poecile atricapillus]